MNRVVVLDSSDTAATKGHEPVAVPDVPYGRMFRDMTFSYSSMILPESAI